jgi:molybdenum cofactor cytidylyltransferase
MGRAPSFCAVILAAGESTRMGRDKALLPWPPVAELTSGTGETFLSAGIRSLSPHADMVIVVAGKNEANLAPVVYARGGFLIRNPAPERGQFSSLQIGLQEVLNRGRDAAIVTLVDRPPVASSTLDRLHRAFEAAYEQERWAVVPEYAGKHGHPIFIGREMMTAFLSASASSTARDVEHAHQQYIDYVSVDDPFVSMNIDTPAEYAVLTQAVPH